MNTSPSFRVKIPAGVLLRDPESGRIVTTGESVPRDNFWARRLAAGEVTELEDEPEAAPETDRTVSLEN